MDPQGQRARTVAAQPPVSAGSRGALRARPPSAPPRRLAGIGDEATATSWRYELEGLVLTASTLGVRAVVTWRGASRARRPAPLLNPVIEKWVEELRGLDVTVDFTPLEHLNAATVRPLVHLVKLLDANETSVRLLFLAVGWQRTHLRCMTAIARTLRHVTVEGR